VQNRPEKTTVKPKARPRPRPKQKKAFRAQPRKQVKEQHQTQDLVSLRREFTELKQKYDRIQKMSQRRSAGSKKRAKAASTKRKNANANVVVRLSQAEKEALMEGIQNLPEEKLETLVSIVAPNSGNKEDTEVELDFDRLSRDVYAKVKRFVTQHARRTEFQTPQFSVASPRPHANIYNGGDDDSESESSDSE